MMNTKTRMRAGCLLIPILLVTSCSSKMALDHARYNLPGEVLRSTVKPTQKLDSAIKVAETLDAYVQPRFEILRDKNFGALRIVFRKHAGIVQLKVDTPQEQELIANANAANRDYAISLLHCAPKPGLHYHGTPSLQLLYFNQRKVAPDEDYYYESYLTQTEAEALSNWGSIEEKVIEALPKLMKGKEFRGKDASWELLMRPVLAANQECLNCHTNAKLNDTLGVMVYAVASLPRGVRTNIGSR